MSNYILYAQRQDLPNETMCNIICGPESLAREKRFIQSRIHTANRSFKHKPWKLKIEVQQCT